jgi:hypothetical protein
MPFLPGIEPGVQQYEQAAPRLETMVGDFVRSPVERPRRSRIEIHANGERDRVQRRGEMKRREPGAFVREGEIMNNISQKSRSLASQEGKKTGHMVELSD